MNIFDRLVSNILLFYTLITEKTVQSHLHSRMFDGEKPDSTLHVCHLIGAGGLLHKKVTSDMTASSTPVAVYSWNRTLTRYWHWEPCQQLLKDEVARSAWSRLRWGVAWYTKGLSVIRELFLGQRGTFLESSWRSTCLVGEALKWNRHKHHDWTAGTRVSSPTPLWSPAALAKDLYCSRTLSPLSNNRTKYLQAHINPLRYMLCLTPIYLVQISPVHPLWMFSFIWKALGRCIWDVQNHNQAAF